MMAHTDFCVKICENRQTRRVDPAQGYVRRDNTQLKVEERKWMTLVYDSER